MFSTSRRVSVSPGGPASWDQAGANTGDFSSCHGKVQASHLEFQYKTHSMTMMFWVREGSMKIFQLFCIGFDNLMGGDAEAKLVRVFEHPITHIAWHNERLAVALDSDEVPVMLFNTQIVRLSHITF